MSKKVGAEKREEAARLLAEGWSTDAIGRRIGVNGTTIRGWRRNNTEFQQLLAKYDQGVYARGLLLAAQRGQPIAVRAKAGASAAETVRGALVDMARKNSRRPNGGININQEES